MEFTEGVLICAIINFQKYDFDVFNLTYLENEDNCFLTFLHYSLVIQGTLLYLLYIGKLTELSATSVYVMTSSIPQVLLQEQRGATKLQVPPVLKT